MAKHYTDERNVQVVLALLKKHGIRKVIASPGTTNMTLVASMQSDAYFEMYSSVDERSAAYIACGLAAESGEPVVISCTGATASRNYLSGLTEAYYRKLPVLAITATQAVSSVGHHRPQVIDRSSLPNDVARFSVTLPIVKDADDLWDCEIKTNQAILELTRHGGGPVHMNLPTTYSRSYDQKELLEARVIHRITPMGDFPALPEGRVAVFVGSHAVMSAEQTEALDRFCAANDAVVFCDHTSGYRGKYRVLYPLVACQEKADLSPSQPELFIYIGEITGDSYSMRLAGKEVWRVSDDGEIRDTFRRLTRVFEMPEKCFFEHYAKDKTEGSDNYLTYCKNQLDDIVGQIPELPFSNLWIASRIASRIPDGSTIHFAILNSLRSWNFFELPPSVTSASNVGGFGIDGCMSSLIGASIAERTKLCFGVIGDLSFFYDMNSIGNRHLRDNLRILLVNNGKGTEFRQYNHVAAHFGEDANEYIAAAGHFGDKSNVLVKHYAENLGFEYLCAADKQEFEGVYERFLTEEPTGRPMLLEVFTDSEDESLALQMIANIRWDVKSETKQRAKQVAHQVLGRRGVQGLKKIIKRS